MFTKNKLIKKYRYYAPNSVHLIPLIREDLFGFNLLTGNAGRMSIGLAGGIKPIDPLLNHRISNQLEEDLANKKDIPFWTELILNAQQYLYQTDYRHSILESVTALELVTSDFIRKICDLRKVSSSDANEYIRNYGLTGNIKVTLKLLLGDAELPEEKIFEKCKGSINIRNGIVHKGRKTATDNEAKDALEYSQKLIKFLTSLN